MGKSGGQSSPSTVTQVTSNKMPGWAEGNAQEFLNKAMYTTNNALMSGAPIYPYSTIAPMNSITTDALQQMYGRAQAGSPLIDTAQSNLQSTLEGNYLSPDSNPYLKATYQQSADDITRNYMNSVVPQLSSAATRAGAFGGSADTLLRGEAMRNLGTTLSDTATNLYGQNYQNERANQLKAMLFAPQMAEQDYADLNKLMGVGDAYQQNEQNLINANLDKWNQYYQYPFYALDKMGQYLGSSYGGTGTSSSQTTQTTPQASLASRIAGGATSGAGLGLAASAMGLSNPMSAALGLIPLIGSLF